MESTYVHQAQAMLTILHTYPFGYLLTQERQGEERVVRGFVYSADLAAQRFFELTGVSLSVEELSRGVGA